MKNLSPIKTRKDHKKYLKRFEEVFDAKPNTPEGDEAEKREARNERHRQKGRDVRWRSTRVPLPRRRQDDTDREDRGWPSITSPDRGDNPWPSHW